MTGRTLTQYTQSLERDLAPDDLSFQMVSKLANGAVRIWIPGPNHDEPRTIRHPDASTDVVVRWKEP
eukprot:863006-Rhodomonas_salina.1